MDTFRVGDYVLYNDGRDSYAGTVISINEETNIATLEVVITIRDSKSFTTIDAPINKLRKRSLV